MADWKPGDRVRVWLSERPGGWAWFSGTVEEVDPSDLPPGVRVDLDMPVNGVYNCFALHDELKPAGTASRNRQGVSVPGQTHPRGPSW